MTDMKKVLPFYYSLSGNTEEDKKLLEPAEYNFQLSGKHLYKKIIPVFNYWLKISPDKLQQIDEIIQIVFNVCILMDDIQDDAVLREGFPVTHSIYGLSYSMNTANYLELIACEKISNLHPMADKILLEELLEFSRGQGMDMYWKHNCICPTEKDYNIVAIRKSGWIIKLAVKLMKLFSTYEEDVLPLACSVALYRQIHDDYCNLRHDKNTSDDSYCDDLTEGKLSFLVIHALTNHPDDKKIMNILKLRTRNMEMKRYFVKILESFGSFKYTEKVLDELDKKMRIEIDRFGGNPIFVKSLDDFKNKMLRTSI
ncbi:PREDICTED: geranylgeranyl pyrophosphate synthase-like [Cyphomyrmex costatus]|uniref:geranylgeranyl pyrophosphate synthase-like n=1 Tax=Cyphomyrmex costatus TaxID=456900 RepID=UPI0008524317|nr:PREDICTED: geranylgeranyl pyrophosphate synthase-like [Cyphomyrmex costatus]